MGACCKGETAVPFRTETDDALPRCPLTGLPMHPLMDVDHDWRRPSDTRPWHIWWSDAAGFGQIHPRPEPSEVASYYDIDHYYTHAERGAPDLRAEARQVGWLGRLLTRIAWRFEFGAEPTQAWWKSVIPQGARRALEIGCGDGDRMRTFGPFVGHATGVEPDARAVRVASERGLDVHEGVAEALPDAVQADRYDLIVFSHVLEHTLDPVAALANAAQLLAPGGLLSCEVPNNECLGAQRMGTAWRWLDAPRHLNFFTESSLRAAAEAAGLRVEAVLFRGYVRQFNPDWMIDEATIQAELEGRRVTPADIARQVRHSARLLLRTALAHPSRKYDSVRILCRKA